MYPVADILYFDEQCNKMIGSGVYFRRLTLLLSGDQQLVCFIKSHTAEALSDAFV